MLFIHFQDKKERIRHALASIGWPMLQAGMSTILAVLVLVIVRAYMIEVTLLYHFSVKILVFLVLNEPSGLEK